MSAQEPAENSLPQRPRFVGRTGELDRLRSAFGAAAGGDGALITLVGEPGIGKTSLCERLASFVSAEGGVTLIGHCYEEGSYRVPYQPFVEAFEAYLRTRGADDLRSELDFRAPDLARIVPSLRGRLDIDVRTTGDPEEDRWRMLQACTDVLHQAAATHPLLLVLEDLHDADRGTLDLLLYLARTLHQARLLVVCTYRDVEVDRVHPLATALTELDRSSSVARIHLRGLSTDEVLNLLAETTQHGVTLAFAELVHRHTDGNPLFVDEVLRFVLEEGLVERRGGVLRRAGEESLAGRIPERLRDAVSKRMSRLSESTQQVLRVASVIGRQFQLQVLREVLGCAADELESGLEEASAAGITEEYSAIASVVTYRFSHAVFRRTVYEEISAPRRNRLHEQIARALEQVCASRLEEHADELAEHYAFSSTPRDLAKAVQYAEIAAAHAANVFAHSEAARHLERAVAVENLLDQDDRRRSDLLLALGDALLPAGEPDRVIGQVAPEALVLAERLGDRSRACRACCLALDGFIARGATSSTALAEYRVWAEKARDNAEAESTQRIHADLALANARQAQNRLREAHALRLEAFALAKRLKEPETFSRAAFWMMYATTPRNWSEGLRVADECAHWPREGVSARSLGVALWASGCLYLAQGRRTRAEELWRELEALTELTHIATLRLLIYQRNATLAVVDGHLEDALGLLREFVERADELGASIRGRFLGLLVLLSPVLYLGREDLWLAADDELVRLSGPAPASRVNIGCRAICLAHTGRIEEASTLVEPLLEDVTKSTFDDEFSVTELSTLLQAAIAVEHRAAVSVMRERLACVAELSTGDWVHTCIARHLGDAARLTGDSTLAHRYYMQALEAAGKIHFRPEVALSHLQLAQLLFDGGALADAAEHLDDAVPQLREMNMLPALERAQALLDEARRLHGEHEHRSPPHSTLLTAREREVAVLIANGLTNRSIAEKLVITEATVEVHVRHILTKHGFRSRAQVAAWVAAQQARRSEQ